MYLVTMQNHGGYTYDGEDFREIVQLDGYREEYPDAEQYLSLIHETDTAASWLINYLSKLEHKCVLVFYGDHLPQLNEHFYEEIHGGIFENLDDEELKQSVPFYIWTNYDIEEESLEYGSSRLTAPGLTSRSVMILRILCSASQTSCRTSPRTR